jgi:site-specific DNA-methyltransferase (adenine-specific)
MFTSDKKYWETPQQFFDELDREFHFTLDAAASHENHKCAKYYTEEDDGLEQDWRGETVFCNPPYGNVETGLWTKKCYEEAKNRGQPLFCLFQPEPTERVSISTYWDVLKYGLFVDG